MVLFELFATLGLDMTSFDQQTESAIQKGETVAESVGDSFGRLQTEATDADTKLDDLETKSNETSAVLQGFAEATGEVVEYLIEGLIDFGKQSIEAAAATGSELANSFNTAKSSFDTTMDALKVKAGNALLPIATGFYNIAESISGVTDAEKLDLLLSRIQEYEFSNIEELRASLDGVFGLFETVESAETKNVSDLTAGLQSQTAYWTEYASTLESLRNKNIDPQFLSDIADGTAESLETLKALESADTTELANLMAAYEAVEETKAATAAGLNEIQLSVDEDLLAMTQSVEDLVAGMNQEEAAKSNAMLTGQGVVTGLAAMSPSITAWVNHINGELARIGEGYTPNNNLFQQALTQGFATNEYGFRYGFGSNASGLTYVPYDGYRTELHRGEGVLTRQENEARRAGGASASDNGALITEVRALKDAILSMQITMNGTTVGRIVTSTVDEEIAWKAGVY